jgi:hypothetical protein
LLLYFLSKQFFWTALASLTASAGNSVCRQILLINPVNGLFYSLISFNGKSIHRILQINAWPMNLMVGSIAPPMLRFAYPYPLQCNNFDLNRRSCHESPIFRISRRCWSISAFKAVKLPAESCIGRLL